MDAGGLLSRDESTAALEVVVTEGALATIDGFCVNAWVAGLERSRKKNAEAPKSAPATRTTMAAIFQRLSGCLGATYQAGSEYAVGSAGMAGVSGTPESGKSFSRMECDVFTSAEILGSLEDGGSEIFGISGRGVGGIGEVFAIVGRASD